MKIFKKIWSHSFIDFYVLNTNISFLDNRNKYLKSLSKNTFFFKLKNFKGKY